MRMLLFPRRRHLDAALHRFYCISSLSSVPPPSSSSRFLDVCVVAARRTPIGSFQGSLASLSATSLGSIAIKGALEDAKLEANLVQEVYMGNVLSAGLGQAPARQAALEAGVAPSAVCTTVNKVCSSGMKAVMLGAQGIMLGLREVVIVGGMESMSNAPYLLPRIRSAKYLGDYNMIDSLMRDGLKDPKKDVSMGIFAEMCAEEMGISREEQDDHAIKSFERAAAAQATGVFKAEIVPVTLPGKKGKQNSCLDSDEECSKFDPDKLESLPPVFKADGTITAGNASSISDGAAALILTSTGFAERNGLPILAYIRGFGDAEQAPEKFPTSPALAIPLALQHAGLHLENIDLFEINEAFSVNVETFKLKGDTLRSVRQVPDEDEEIIFAELYGELTTADTRSTRSQRGRGVQAGGRKGFLIRRPSTSTVVDLANRRLLGLTSDDVNIHGGAVSLGHPIGASGARIIISLITSLALKGLNLGVAAICNGGGGGSALVIEREKKYRLYEHEIGHKH